MVREWWGRVGVFVGDGLWEGIKPILTHYTTSLYPPSTTNSPTTGRATSSPSLLPSSVSSRYSLHSLVVPPPSLPSPAEGNRRRATCRWSRDEGQWWRIGSGG